MANRVEILVNADDSQATTTLSGLSKKVGLAMTGAGAAITGAMALSVKSAMDFEGAMREVNSMMGLGQDEFEDLSKQVKDLSVDMGVDATNSAKALYQAISAGVPKDNAIEFMAVATKAAIAGVTDTETAVDGLTSVMNAFKMPMSDAQKVADIMFQTVKGGKTTFDELSSAIFNVAPIAAASNVAFEDVSAALATMTKQGVPTKIATTQLRQAMVALQKPTKEMNDVISDLGYESGQAMLAEKGFAKTLNVLRDSTGGSNEMLMKMFGSVEAGQAVLALTGQNAEMFKADLDAIASASEGAGAATDAYNEINQGANRQFEMMMAQVKGLAIDVGTILIPILQDLVGTIKPVIEAIVNWMQENPGLTKVLVILTAAIGALMLVLGPLLIALPSLIAGYSLLTATIIPNTASILSNTAGWIANAASIVAHKVAVVASTVATAALTAAQWALNAAMTANPIGLVVAAVVGLIAVGVLLVKNWDKVKSAMATVWDGIVWVVKSGANLYITYINGIIWALESLINVAGKALNAIPDFNIPSWVPGIGGKSFGIPNIPSISLPRIPILDTGAIVTKPTLAMLSANSKPEGVYPLDGNKSPMGKGDIVINFNAPVYGMADFKRQVGKAVRDITLGGGFNGILETA